MFNQIIVSRLPHVEDPEPTQPVLIAISQATRDKKALIDCVVASLNAIEQANRDYDYKSRQIAIIEYDDNLKRAQRAGLSQSDINSKCRQAHYQCLVANLHGLAVATVTGNYYTRVNDLIAWYEEDRQRMLEAGYQGKAIDSRMTKIKLTLVKK